MLKGEKAKKVIWLILILVALYLASNIFELTLLNLVTKYLAILFVVSLPIIFHQELQEYFFDKNSHSDEDGRQTHHEKSHHHINQIIK